MNVSKREFAAKLEQHRNLLRFLARRAIPTDLRAKIDASDIAQETMIKAVAGVDGFRGRDTQDLVAFLRAILRNQIVDECRKATADKRDVTLERSIDAAIDDSRTRLGNLIPAGRSTPSKHLQREEKLMFLADALCSLSDDQRMAIELHHLEELSLDETARKMGRTAASVAGLLRRGLAALNRLLPDEARSTGLDAR